jgi:hypothetical protein
VGLGLLGLLGSAMRAGGAAGPEIGAGSPNLDIILLIDNSAGMSQALAGDPASDPNELRIRAAKFLVDFLKANAEATGANHRVGVASFGGVISDTIPLRPLGDNVVRDRIHGEVIDYTDVRPALRYALGELKGKSFGSDNKMAVVVFTDGQPWPVGAGEPTITDTQKYFLPTDQDPKSLAALLRELQDRGVQVFVLGIGNAKRDQANWTQEGLLPEQHFIPISSTTDLADTYHRLAGELLGLAVQPGKQLSPGETVAILVEPYLKQLIISFMKSDPAIVITLTSPSGDRAIAATDSGSHHLVYRIPNPPFDGPWMASWTGKGEVQYWVDRYYPLVKVSLDASLLYTGQPFTVTAGLFRNGVVVTDAALRFDAEIVAPNTETLMRSLELLNNGYHARVITDVLPPNKTYTVTARVRLEGRGSLTVTQKPVNIVVLPLPLLIPAPGPTTIAAASSTAVSEATLTPTPTPTATASSAVASGGISTPTATPILPPTVTPTAIVIPTPPGGDRVPVWPQMREILARFSWLVFVLGLVIVLAIALLRYLNIILILLALLISKLRRIVPEQRMWTEGIVLAGDLASGDPEKRSGAWDRIVPGRNPLPAAEDAQVYSILSQPEISDLEMLPLLTKKGLNVKKGLQYGLDQGLVPYVGRF